MFTLRNKVARTILFCSQCCYLTEETEKDKQRQTQERGKEDNFLQTGLSRLCVPGCPSAQPHTQSRAKQTLADVTDWHGRGEGKPTFLYNSFILFVFCVVQG